MPRGFRPVPLYDPREVGADRVLRPVAQTEPSPLADLFALHAAVAQYQPTQVQSWLGRIARNETIERTRGETGAIVTVPVEVELRRVIEGQVAFTRLLVRAQWGVGEEPSNDDLQAIKTTTGMLVGRTVKVLYVIEYDPKDKYLPPEQRRRAFEGYRVAALAPLAVERKGLGDLWFLLTGTARQGLLG
jgi:hypothetical protein